MATQDALELCFAPITELAGAIAAGEISPVELTAAVLARSEQHNDEMGVYITITREIALAQAKEAEAEIHSGKYRGPLHGIPIALKDNISTRGIRTSCASPVNPDWIPDDDATVYQKLRTAGAILIGKANLFEYAFSMNPSFAPQPLNPWHPGKTSAGSSSGSAVAVATGMAQASLGSDTGGSGRVPAHVNGVVGLKPTYGRASRAGIVPLSFSLDNPSVFSRTVRDAGLVLEAISGHDPRDRYSAALPVPDMNAKIGHDVTGLRIGIARGFTVAGIDPDVDAAIDAAIGVLEDLGASTEEVELPFVEHCVALQNAIMLPEAASVHYQTLRETPELLGEAALMRLDLENVIPAVDYVHAQQMRESMRDGFRELFTSCDVIVGAANPARAGDAGSWMTEIDGKRFDLREVGPEYTGIYNLAGLPAIVAPAGFSSEGTPVGLQIAGRWFDEPTILQVASAFEQATNWQLRRPPYPAE